MPAETKLWDPPNAGPPAAVPVGILVGYFPSKTRKKKSTDVARPTAPANIWADLDGQNSNALLTRYVRGSAIDQVFARIGADGSAYWLLTDNQGNVRNVIDNTGVVKDAIAYIDKHAQAKK